MPSSSILFLDWISSQSMTFSYVQKFCLPYNNWSPENVHIHFFLIFPNHCGNIKEEFNKLLQKARIIYSNYCLVLSFIFIPNNQIQNFNLVLLTDSATCCRVTDTLKDAFDTSPSRSQLAKSLLADMVPIVITVINQPKPYTFSVPVKSMYL